MAAEMLESELNHPLLVIFVFDLSCYSQLVDL